MISFLGILRPDGCLPGCFNGTDCSCTGGTPTPHVEGGIPVWEAQGGGRGLIVVEARRGSNNRNPGTFFPVSDYTADPPPDAPSLQIEVSRPLGVSPKVGSLDVCDTGLPPPQGIGGGIPAVDPPDFGGSQSVVNALNDYACRFIFTNASTDACSRNANGNFSFLGSQTREQYCYNADVIASFQEGDTLFTVRVLDTSGVPGPVSRMIVRVPSSGP